MCKVFGLRILDKKNLRISQFYKVCVPGSSLCIDVKLQVSCEQGKGDAKCPTFVSQAYVANPRASPTAANKNFYSSTFLFLRGYRRSVYIIGRCYWMERENFLGT